MGLFNKKILTKLKKLYLSKTFNLVINSLLLGSSLAMIAYIIYSFVAPRSFTDLETIFNSSYLINEEIKKQEKNFKEINFKSETKILLINNKLVAVKEMMHYLYFEFAKLIEKEETKENIIKEKKFSFLMKNSQKILLITKNLIKESGDILNSINPKKENQKAEKFLEDLTILLTKKIPKLLVDLEEKLKIFL